MTPQHAVDALHHVDPVLVRQGHVRRVHDVLQLFQFPGRFFDDACVACGDGRELRGREVLVADHAAITVNVDVRDFAHEQNTLLHLAGRADEVADGFQGVVVSLPLLINLYGLLPSIISQMPPLFTWAIEAIDVDEAVDKLREGQSDCIFSFHDEDLLEAPFDHIRLFESQLFPVCASDEHGEALFNLAQPHFPLLNYSRNSYMGRLINRTLTRHSELSFSTFFVSSMSELLKQVALDGCGIAWLPEYAIQQEIRSGKLVVLNRDELVIPIQAYAYRMNTRMNPVAERFWRELRELEIVLS